MIQSILLMGAGKATNSSGGGSAVPVVNRSTFTGDSGNNCGDAMNCVLSPAPASGRLLLAFLQDGTGASPGPPTNGTGTAWTQFGAAGKAWYCYTNSAQPTSYAITYYGVAKADSACWVLVEMTGVFSTPIDTFNATAGSAVSPSITTGFVYEKVISVVMSSSTATTDITEPAGWTSVIKDQHGGFSGSSAIGVASKDFLATGATGTATWTLATGSPSYVFTIGVRSQ